MSVTIASRRERRQHIGIPDQVGLLNDDADQQENNYVALQKRIDKAISLLWASLGSLVVGALLMAANLMVRGPQ